MPIYEYKCSDCGNLFEELVPRVTEETKPCPGCKSSNTKKQMSVIGAISMTGSSAMPSCANSCPSASSCQSMGGGCCGGGG